MKIYIRSSRRSKKSRIRAAQVRMFDELVKMINEYDDIPKGKWNKASKHNAILDKIRSTYYAGSISIHEYQDLMDMLQMAS